MATNPRRKILVAGGLIAFGAGFSATAKRMFSPLLDRSAPKNQYHGASLEPEFNIDPAIGTLKVNPAQQVSYTMCLGCTTLCGVRVCIDRTSGKVLRVAGNRLAPLAMGGNGRLVRADGGAGRRAWQTSRCPAAPCC